MIFDGAQRGQLREAYASAWGRARAGLPLEPLDAAIADVVGEHPEYQAILEDRRAIERDFPVENGQVNPFLHMGMHLAIREQVATDRPAGVQDVHARLAARLGAHAAEHRMMERLGEALWEAQRSGRPPDERLYLEQLQQLL